MVTSPSASTPAYVSVIKGAQRVSQLLLLLVTGLVAAACRLFAKKRVRWSSAVIFILFLVLLQFKSRAKLRTRPSPWTWRCVSQDGGDARCIKEALVAGNAKTGMSLNKCKLVCGEYSTLWPYPSSAKIGKSVVHFRPSSITKTILAGPQETAFVEESIKTFLQNLDQYHPKYGKGMTLWPTESDSALYELHLDIKIDGPPQSHLSLNTDDEKYSLSVHVAGKIGTAKISAKTFFGARHGLETLSQLIDYEEEEDSLQLVRFAKIADKPAFPYRGILLDTSRNFITIKTIERTLDAMAANKLNTFHWHITDTHSFPMVLKSLPNMAYYGAYSPSQLYEPEDIRHIVEYGRVRGVRVLPEFDAPAHVGNGWEWGPQQGLGDLAVCVNQEPWYDFCVEPPCGQLNIANKNIYHVLGKIYQEMAEMFGPLDLFHYGGDEVNLTCWNTTKEIADYMMENENDLSADSYYKQWSIFQSRAYELFTEANKGVEIPGILWTSHLTEKGRTDKYLDRNKYIIQIWSSGTDPLIKELLDKRFRVIFSNSDAWYLDCGVGAWVGEGNNWCSPYKGWQKVYDNSPNEIATNITGDTADLSLILGGEVALWTEQADDAVIDSRLWPRAAALAERLWSNPEHNWEPAEFRMIHQRQRLVKRGIQADRLQPEWCHQNEGQCYARGGKTTVI